MKVKTMLAISLFVIASSTTGIALASCGSCGEESSCDGGGSSCSCSDPGAVNFSSCTGAGRYCELFGNPGQAPAHIQSGHDDSDDDDAVTQGISYNDFRGTDDQFNRRTYNVDAPRPQYK